MRNLAWILKRVYKLTFWRNPDGTFGADVTWTKSDEPVEFGEQSLEWLIDTIEKELL